jgi:formylglycine-generating enzyme required for sulfatase activity
VLINRICFAFAATLLLGCGNAEQSTPQGKEVIDRSMCLNVLPVSVRLEGGRISIGSNNAYLEERPERQVKIASFEIDTSEVTNGQFSKFIEDTGYITDAEKTQAGFDVPGGAVFSSPSTESPSWWQFVEGANWRQPEGPNSTIEGRDLDPVVQVTLNDARAYSDWAGRRLPTEAEWEFAAKAGANSLYVWGDERAPDGQEKANTWQGAFPIENTMDDGFGLRAPIGCFEPNAFGLYDMIGNVWEWTDTAWGDGQSQVIKGGSFLCAENFCRRYRASARQAQEANFSTNHIGFRTVID